MIRLELPYPISANRYWRPVIIKGKAGAKGHITIVPTADAKIFKQDVAWLASKQGLRKPIPGPVEVTLQLYPHRPLDWEKRAKADPLWWDMTVRCIDLDNARKVLWDALKGIAFEDDNMIRKDPGEIMIPDGEARVVLTIQPYQRAHPQAGLFADDYDPKAHQAAPEKRAWRERIEGKAASTEERPF